MPVQPSDKISQANELSTPVCTRAHADGRLYCLDSHYH